MGRPAFKVETEPFCPQCESRDVTGKGGIATRHRFPEQTPERAVGPIPAHQLGDPGVDREVKMHSTWSSASGKPPVHIIRCPGI